MTTQSNAQAWMRLDASPFREIREILAQELHRSPEDVQAVSFTNEIKQVPSEDGEWANYEATGRSWFTLTFPDEAKFTFVKDQDGVRLGKLPESNGVLSQ